MNRDVNLVAPTGADAVPLADGGYDLVVREEPLVLDVNGTRIVTMRTPMGEEMDRLWALGFLASEGVIADVSEVRDIVFKVGAGILGADESAIDEVQVRLWRSGPMERIGLLARTQEMRASCGLCGAKSAKALIDGMPHLADGTPQIECSKIPQLVETLRSSQKLFAATGGSHGTIITRVDGTVLAFAEDIGRHNALDRAIGSCLKQGHYLRDTVVVVSGRAGYELVMKALRAGIPIFLSVGAASTFAFELASAAHQTLVGFIREEEAETRMNVYTNFGRLKE